MDKDDVRNFEEACEKALATVLKKKFPKAKVPPRTCHLMAKAAVSVLEAVMDEPPRR
jgi:hypothetical protein